MSEENQKDQELESQNQNSYENFDTSTNPRTDDTSDLYAKTNTTSDQQVNQNEANDGQPGNVNMNGYQNSYQNPNMNGYQNPYQNQNSYQNPNMNGYQNQQNYAYGRVMEQEKASEGLGIASLIIGIVSILLSCACINIPIAIVGIVLGIVQLTKHGKKIFAIFGIVLSSISIVAGIVFWIFMFSTPEFDSILKDTDNFSYYGKTTQIPDYNIEQATFYYEK